MCMSACVGDYDKKEHLLTDVYFIKVLFNQLSDQNSY